MPAESLAALLESDEGRVRHAYQDHLGYWTIGVGHLIDKRKGGGLPDFIIDALLEHDIAEKTAEVERALPWVKDLDDARRAALLGWLVGRDWQCTESWFCSELVAWSFEQGGSPLFRDGVLSRVTPQNLWMIRNA